MITTRKAILGTLLTVFTFSAAAETIPGTGLSVHLESAGLLGSGTTLNISRLPVRNTSTDEVSYYNVILRLTLDGNNQPTFERISSLAPATPPGPDICIPGLYQQSGVSYQYQIVGPVSLPGGRLGCVLNGVTFSTSISWTSGSPIDHPEIGTRSIVSDPSRALSAVYIYGLAGSDNINSEFTHQGIRTGDLIGVRQSGNIITFFDFTSGGVDQVNPLTSVTLTRVEPAE